MKRIIATIAISIAMLAGCKSTNKIVGKWQYSLPFHKKGKQISVIEFKKDGTAVIDSKYESTTFNVPDQQQSFNYTIEKNQVTLVNQNKEAYKCTFRIQNDDLVLTTPDLETKTVTCVKLKD